MYPTGMPGMPMHIPRKSGKGILIFALLMLVLLIVAGAAVGIYFLMKSSAAATTTTEPPSYDYVNVPNTGVSNGIIGDVLSGKTLSECQNACDADDNCIGFMTDFANGSGNCSLMNNTAAPGFVSDQYTYIKQTDAGYIKYPDTDIPFNDFKTIDKNISLQTCLDNCSAKDDCVGVAVQPKGDKDVSMCWYKNKFGTGANTNSKRTMYIRT